MKCYAVFSPLEHRGIYESWDKCKAVIDGCRGASFSSFKTAEMAKDALKAGSLMAYKAHEAKTRAMLWKTVVKMPCLAVDAACSQCGKQGGPVEYRGVVLSTAQESFEVFRCGPYPSGTNNIGEFLGLVTGLRWLQSTSLPYDIYTDSATAIKWVRTLGYCNSKLETVGRELAMEIKVAENWLRTQDSDKYLERIRKWDTREWGEIPADYDRK